jgi:dTDP-4-dehydrorhamnose reductase
MKYFVTGKNGQLAGEFIRRFEKLGIEYFAPDESRLDITDAKTVLEAVSAYKPDIIVNCASYNSVDQAEREWDAAYRVNAGGPRNLARAAKKHNSFLVHFGSDYVFDGLKEDGLYTEKDEPNPLNEYGRSKLSGEELVLSETERSLVLRLSWVFGVGSRNFIYKLMDWAENNEYLKVACDEFSAPTHTATVVDAVLRSIDLGLTGRHHCTNGGYCSRYEWARLVMRTLRIDKFVRPTSMSSFNLPAKRPGFSAMSSASLERTLGAQLPPWETAVESFLLNGRKYR